MINFLTQQLFPNLYTYFCANKKVSKMYEVMCKLEVKEIEPNKVDLNLKKIEIELENQQERKKGIEEKVKSILFIITIAITAITFTLNYEKWNLDSFYEIISLVSLCLSILYFVFAAITCIQTLNLRPFNVISTRVILLQNELEIEPEKNNSEKLKEYIKYKALNENIITQLTNFAYSSFTSIRNGIILFSLYFILVSIQNFSSKTESKNIFNFTNEVEVKINDSMYAKIPYNIKFEIAPKDFKMDKIEFNQKRTSDNKIDSTK